MVTANSAPSKNHDWPSITPSLFALFQTMQSIVVYMPDPEKQKKAFSALAKASLLLGIIKDGYFNNPEATASVLDVHGWPLYSSPCSIAIVAQNAWKSEAGFGW